MRPHKAFLLFVVLFFGVVAWMRIAPPVLAAPPDHDDFDNARFVSPLPYSDIADTTEATTAFDDPYEESRAYSVWYAFTAENREVIEANTFGSNYNTTLAVYTGVRGALNLVAQNNDYNGSQSLVNFAANPGTTYYFMIGACCEWEDGTGGELHFLVKAVSPPPNDNFAQATVVSGLPFEDMVAGIGATLEPNEPTPSCSSSTIRNSVWYAYTPPADEWVSALYKLSESEDVVLAVYTGSNIDNLTEIACQMSWYWQIDRLTLGLHSGTTYYYQVGNPYGQSAHFRFALQPPPPPSASISYYPSPPSSYDNIQFYSWGEDPAQVGFESWAWDFGDGTTAMGESTSHRYAADGKYTVTLTATTIDGRQAIATTTVNVRSSDVAIIKFTTPKSGKVGRTAEIVVGVSSRRYPETVTVDLRRSGPFGFYTVGTLTLYVPVQKNNRTTDFVFSYTFTPQDGEIGKVNFKAVASIQEWSDVLPGDNEAISFPTTVRGDATIASVETEEMQEGFLLRDEMDNDPELRDLFLLPSHWLYMPVVKSIKD